MQRCCFFLNDTATTEIYTLSLHDALPIWLDEEPDLDAVSRRLGDSNNTVARLVNGYRALVQSKAHGFARDKVPGRSEEHTSELQSRQYLVCRLLLEKK